MSNAAESWKHGRLRCADAVHARFFDDELVILDLAKGEYFALDAIGARLWSGLQGGKGMREIAQEIASEYDVDLESALTDLCVLGDDLVLRGLLVNDERTGMTVPSPIRCCTCSRACCCAPARRGVPTRFFLVSGPACRRAGVSSSACSSALRSAMAVIRSLVVRERPRRLDRRRGRRSGRGALGSSLLRRDL